MAELIFMMVLIAVGWFWLDSMRVREIAIAVVKQFCTQQGLQMLDGAVAFASIKLERDSQGRLALARTYRFEFSDNGENRLSGMLTMLDKQAGPMHVEAFNSPSVG